MKTPKSNRPHIGIFGRRNVGKSSLINAITRQDLSIVSATPGTTTDPVEKAMELLPFGPVVFIDTAGLDDVGDLGRQRADRSYRILERTDLALVVIEGEPVPSDLQLVDRLREVDIPFIPVFNKADVNDYPVPLQLGGTDGYAVSALTGNGISELAARMIQMLESLADDLNMSLTGDLVPPGGLAVLVVPIDKEAPAGRLILPQVQTIRDLLDNDAYCMVVKDRELYHALEALGRKPDIVITDSQAFLKVSADVPEDIPMTSFSILFARQKGDLSLLAEGARAIDRLKDGDSVLIAEACTHHAVGDDIGTVKIPRMLRQYTGRKLDFRFAKGKNADMPSDVALMIHCGGCMLNRRAMLSRLRDLTGRQIPVTNYGMTLAYTMGIFERALKPFNPA